MISKLSLNTDTLMSAFVSYYIYRKNLKHLSYDEFVTELILIKTVCRQLLDSIDIDKDLVSDNVLAIAIATHFAETRCFEKGKKREFLLECQEEAKKIVDSIKQYFMAINDLDNGQSS